MRPPWRCKQGQTIAVDAGSRNFSDSIRKSTNSITTPMLLQLDSIVLHLPLTAVCRSRSSLFMSWILSVVLCAPLCPSVVNVFLGAELAKTTTTSYNSRHGLIGATKKLLCTCCSAVRAADSGHYKFYVE